MKLASLRALTLLFLTVPALLGGCTNLGYYYQSVRGQIDLLQRAQPIKTLITDHDIQAPLKLKLATVLRIREFASRELHLPDNGSYRSYADLERPYVVWNVFATPELSVHPIEWCFPFAGCVDYRGYFSKPEAEAFAAGLRARGYDVFVGGVHAYSTLGWFNDPVLSTFIHFPETEIARVIFHELAHQVAYVRNDSVFNESFAVAVEQEGLRRWLEREGTDKQRAASASTQRRKREFIALVLKYRNRLEALFSSPLSVAQKRQSKARIFRELQEEYLELKAGWGGFRGYDRWFTQEPNSAHLASVAIYTQLVPAFQALLAEEDGNLPYFYAAVTKLGNLPEGERLAQLQQLVAEAKQMRARNPDSPPAS